MYPTDDEIAAALCRIELAEAPICAPPRIPVQPERIPGPWVHVQRPCPVCFRNRAMVCETGEWYCHACRSRGDRFGAYSWDEPVPEPGPRVRELGRWCPPPPCERGINVRPWVAAVILGGLVVGSFLVSLLWRNG